MALSDATFNYLCLRSPQHATAYDMHSMDVARCEVTGRCSEPESTTTWQRPACSIRKRGQKHGRFPQTPAGILSAVRGPPVLHKGLWLHKVLGSWLANTPHSSASHHRRETACVFSPPSSVGSSQYILHLPIWSSKGGCTACTVGLTACECERHDGAQQLISGQ